MILSKDMDLKGKNVAVVGLAKSGLAAALFLKKLGAKALVTDCANNQDVLKSAEVLSREKIKYEIGKHTEKFLTDTELMVISPGAGGDAPPIVWAQRNKIPVISEIELGFLYCKAPVIAVTGTNGKTTVTGLIEDMFKTAHRKVIACGNIGNPFTEKLDDLTSDSAVVLEVSSFQLERIETFKPKVSIILNVTQDHLDRYRNMKEYLSAKCNIFRNQDGSDYLILNHDDHILRNIKNAAGPKVLFFSRFAKVTGAFLEGDVIYCDIDGKSRQSLCAKKDIYLKGDHNIENAMAAVLAAKAFGVSDKDIMKSLSAFKGFAHRFELVSEIDGVRFIDDSKGTTVDSAKRALESCLSQVILIAGGRDKNSDFTLIKDTVKEKVKLVIVIGEAKDKLRAAYGDVTKIYDAETIEAAVQTAHGLAANNDIVLLSPMCASFDMFKDYKHRGDAFKKAVLDLKKNKTVNLK